MEVMNKALTLAGVREEDAEKDRARRKKKNSREEKTLYAHDDIFTHYYITR